MAQQTMVRFDASTIASARSMAERSSPVAASVLSQSAARAAAANSSYPWVCSSTKAVSTAPPVSRIILLSSRNRAWSPPIRICRKRSLSAVPLVRPWAVCGFLNRSRPASGSGFTEMIFAPAFLACSSAESILG